jgi:hypothetical protein
MKQVIYRGTETLRTFKHAPTQDDSYWIPISQETIKINFSECY